MTFIVECRKCYWMRRAASKQEARRHQAMHNKERHKGQSVTTIRYGGIRDIPPDDVAQGDQYDLARYEETRSPDPGSNT